MKITLTTIETFDLSDKQISLLRRLSQKHGEYLFDEDMELADVTKGIVDTGEGYYEITQKGRRILVELDNQLKNQ